MTTYQLIKSLKKQGYRVSFSKRKDGGYLIKSIGKQKFTGAKGNIQAREILGVQLSKAREFQLNRINQAIRKRRTPLSKQLKAKIARVQRIWRKTHPTSKGTIKTSSVRYQLETYGEEEAFEKLEKAERYALGYAYRENVEFLRERLNQLTYSEEYIPQEFEDLIKRLDKDEIALNFKEEWIQKIYEIYYDIQKGTKSIEQGTFEINQIIK